MDQHSLDNLNTLHPKFRPSAIQAWAEAQAAMPTNVQIIVIQGLRSFAESNELYKIGRTVMGDNPTPEHPMGEIVTKAPGGSSYHNYGLAFDFKMITNGHEDNIVGPNWLKVVSIMESYGMTWGGHFPEGFHDDPHFENRYGRNWRDLLGLYKTQKFINGTEYVDI